MTRASQLIGNRPLAALLMALCLLAGLVLSTAVWAQTQITFPALTGRVTDAANILPADVSARIAAKLAAHEAKSSDQLVVATVPSLQGLDIADYANRLYRHWQIGTKDKNNGALLLIAPQERKVRIEVGYGLEGALTDALSKTIISTIIAPKFRNGDFAGGIEAGTDGMLALAAKDAAEWQRVAPSQSSQGEAGFDIFLILFVIIVIFIIVVVRSMLASHGQGGVRRSHRTSKGNWIVLPGSSSGWGGGWSSSSGSGSWGGGFSGGGGSSGGGGASGDW